MVGGALLLYFTNSLYEPPVGKFQQPMKLDPAHAHAMHRTPVDPDTNLPLLRPLCAPPRAPAGGRALLRAGARVLTRAAAAACWQPGG